VGHAFVDLAGEFDEAGVDAEFPCFPGQIKRINGNTLIRE
jgi:hypothetical protein